MRICLTGGKVFASDCLVDDGCVVVREGRIEALGARPALTLPSDAEVIDVTGMSVVPGLIDLHVHGIRGQDVADGDLASISRALAEHGVTAFVATLIAAPHSSLLTAIERVATAADLSTQKSVAEVTPSSRRISVLKRRRGEWGARIVGIHLEGPYISSHYAGALDPRFFRLPNRGEAGELLLAGRGKVRMVTIAPELDGALELISWLSSQGVIPSVGHSAASFEQVTEAARNGLRHATHTFNAMRQFHHRQPGAAGAALYRDEITVELIADGYHLHPAVVGLILRLKGVERTCLVSDVMPLADLPPGAHTWLGQSVVGDGRTAALESGALAGSITPLDSALRRLVEMTGLPLEVALNTASRTPARVLSLNSGTLEVGRDADIVVLDDAFCVCLTMVQGRVVYTRPDRLLSNP